MDIKRTAWHYRLINFFMTPAGNLCSYFWELVASLTLFPALLPLWPPGYLVARLVDMSLPSGEYTLQDARRESESQCVGWVILCGLVFPLLLFASILFLIIRIVNLKKDRGPGLFLTWLKAKKDHLCPLIRFV